MTLKSQIISDVNDVFLNNDEFSVDILYNAATIRGIFDNDFAVAVEGENGVETTVPAVQVNSTEVASAVQGETMTINSIVYKITGIHPDGTGMTVILLSQD